MNSSRCLDAAMLSLVVTLGGSGCDLLFGVYCLENTDCPSTEVCGSAGVCVSGDRPDGGDLADGGFDPDGGDPPDGGNVLTLFSVDGSGSSAGVFPLPDIDGGLPASRRIVDRLIVTGTGFDEVTSADLIADDGSQVALDIAERTDGEMELIIPENQVSPGLVTLTLLAAAVSTQVSAQVFIVQGEPAPPTVSSISEPTPQECPFGGQVLIVGPDANGDGAPDSGERVVICEGNVITANETRTVSNLIELNAALEALRDVRITPGNEVTIQLQDGAYGPVTTPIVFDHPNGNQIRIFGNGEIGLVSLSCASTITCFDVVGSVLHLDGITLSGDAPFSGTGFTVGRGGRIVLGPDVRMSSFNIPVMVTDGGSFEAEELGISESINGLFVLDNGIATVADPSFNNVRFPVIALGGRVVISNAVMTRTEKGVQTAALQALAGGTVISSGGSIERYDTGVFAGENGFVSFRDGSINDVNRGIVATGLSRIIADPTDLGGFTNLANVAIVGLVANESSSISFKQGVISNAPNGIESLLLSRIVATDAVLNGITGTGVTASDFSAVYAIGLEFSGTGAPDEIDPSSFYQQ